MSLLGCGKAALGRLARFFSSKGYGYCLRTNARADRKSASPRDEPLSRTTSWAECLSQENAKQARGTR